MLGRMALRIHSSGICAKTAMTTIVRRAASVVATMACEAPRVRCASNSVLRRGYSIAVNDHRGRKYRTLVPPNGNDSVGNEKLTVRESYFKWYRDKSRQHAASTVGGGGAAGQSNANVVVLMQVGSFFEIYDEVNLDTGECITNAAAIADAVGLACSRKVEGRIQKEMYGFPEYQLSKFEGMLVRNGFTVVVIEQRKDSGGIVVDRRWVRTSTSSTFEEGGSAGTDAIGGDSLVSDKHIWGLRFHVDGSGGVSGAAAAVNCSTGDIAYCDVAGKQFRLDDIDALMQGYPVSELVVWSSGQKVDVRNVLNLPSSVQVFERKPLPGGAGIANREMDVLVRAFKREAAIIVDAADIAHHPDRRSVMAHLIDHVRNFDPKLTESLQLPTVMCASSHMRLGKRTLPQLNVTGDRGYAQLFVRGTRTKLGQRAIMKRICDPIYDAKLLTERFDRVRDTMGWIDRNRKESADAVDQVRRRLGQIRDLRRLKRRLETGSFSAADLHLLISSVDAWRHIRSLTGTSLADESTNERDFVKHLSTSWDLQRCSDYARGPISSGASQPAAAAHPWARGVHPDLDELEDEWLACKANYSSLMQRSLESFSGPKVPLAAFDNDDVAGQPFLPSGTKSRCDKLAKWLRESGDIDVHVHQESKNVYYVESKQLNEINKKGLQVAASLTKRIKECWRDEVLAADVKADDGAIIDNDDFGATGTGAAVFAPASDSLAVRSAGKGWSDLEASIAAVDVELAIAQVALERDFCLPTIDEPASTSKASSGSGLDIKGLRHPLVVENRPDVPYTPNDVRLGAGVAAQHDGMLLFGANGTGKSTLMKAIGIAVLSAQAGLPIAAVAMRLVPYKSLFSRILGNDDLFAGLSSFDVEMNELRHILDHADARTLVLGDELCSGTEALSAAAIMGTGIELLSDKGTQFIFATHLHSLRDMPSLKQQQRPRLLWNHLGATFDPSGGKMQYERKLKPGPGSPTYGIEVCKAKKMETAFTDRAFELRTLLFGLSKSRPATGAKQ